MRCNSSDLCPTRQLCWGEIISPQPVADFQGVLDVHGAAAVLDDNLNGSDGINWNSRLVLPLPVMNRGSNSPKFP